MIKLKVDHREPSDLKEWLRANAGVECIFENLPAGDFEFILTPKGGETNEAPRSLMLIERKEIADLCSSLSDGRFDDQKQKLSASAASEPRPIVLLIEGNYALHEKATTIDSIALTTQFRDGFFVLRSTGALNGDRSTGVLLKHIAELFVRGKFEPITLDEQHRRFISSRAAHRAGGQLSRKQDWWQLALAQIDGVGPKAAEAITGRYPTAQALIDAYRTCRSQAYRNELLSDIVMGSRRIGSKISEKICSTVCGERGSSGSGTASGSAAPSGSVASAASVASAGRSSGSSSSGRGRGRGKPVEQPIVTECLFDVDGEE
jgi:ERCC4-type nuclease